VLGGLRGIYCSSEGEAGDSLLGAVLSVTSVWLCGIHRAFLRDCAEGTRHVRV
jgi:hypothetical protein